MKKDHSYGIIPFSEEDGQYFVLLVKNDNGHWGLPKGHMEDGETPKQAAVREFEEETGLNDLTMIDAPQITEVYVFERDGAKIEKTNVYFMASTTYQEPVPRLDDVTEAKWFLKDDAIERITFETSKDTLRAAIEILEIKRI